ncbi:RagB/SusD family nutrient uptake outer membrane protein [Parabacteroides sp. FAFU027]|uniref:RagB/SusD family nutrient uptake outer membrane protein n=1 Tax=Parabacteroides sp. FAFU027 TaxID=2922715 RepID=UPI001FB01A04|nr:RagB/SusD family nutrient uptake outer membrane protein [Parabacteroides sp. FAFU027]
MKNKLLTLVASVMLFSSCSGLLSPADQNDRELDGIYTDAPFAEGLLLDAYVRIPSNGYSFNDVATDDAVSNNKDNSYLLMATGKWSSLNNPTDQWTNANAAIQYLNTLLAESDKVTWATSGKYTNEMFNDRIKGEAYGLRALFMYNLLQAHGGWTADGKLLGFPILTKPQNPNSDFKLPRNTYKECLDRIYMDLDSAEYFLPLDFEDVASASKIPAKYADKTIVSDYNRVFGAYNRQRLSARIVKGIRSRVSLLAASPAFSSGTSVPWDKAADDAAAVLDLINGISGMASNGGYWYAKKNSSEISGLSNGVNPKEVLWRTNVSDENGLEKDNYPPTLFGSGRINPTQNLVDAFPMLNGYPITDSKSTFDANNPYKNRDPRLAQYIVVNNSTMGPSSSPIFTSVGKTDDGLNAIAKSTRTGYYMRKLLREDVNLNPSSTNTQKHYVARIRYTEIFLSYAEAANEAWGPDGKGTHNYSARDVIAAIRKRAGIKQPDSYLQSISTKEDMRTLIHNERRLELCFEGSRFWDLRRWKENIKTTAKGVTIDASGTISYNDVEPRVYGDHMLYGPLPYTEVLKWGLEQNAGW